MRNKRTLSRTTKKRLLLIGRCLILTFFLLNVILPIYWMVITSFKTSPEIINAHEITYFPKVFTLENYQTLFKLYDYGTLLKNSVILSVTTGTIVTIFSLFGGYGMARYRFKGKGALNLFFLLTQMVPGILVTIPIYVLYSKIGLINTAPGLIILFVIGNIPFTSITMRSFFERIPASLEEAAWVDGCSRMQGIVKIVLPVMLPGIVSVFIFAFIGAWNDLMTGTIFISSSKLWTIPVGLKSMIGKYSVPWGTLMAGGVMAMLPTSIMFVFMQKYIVEGMTAGSVKE